MTITYNELVVNSLGGCQHLSPLDFHSPSHPQAEQFVPDEARIRSELAVSADAGGGVPLSLELAGPREAIYFDPAQTTAAIVTCGGLSPGLNNVIRSAFCQFTESYGLPRVLGIRNGYLGLNPEPRLEPIVLTREYVESIDKLGGTVLGSSRGPQEPAVMADYLQSLGVGILLCVGGDGTQRGAKSLDDELRRRGAKIAVVGIPKTIDNDVPFVRLSFGYATALEKAAEVIRGAHVEARDAVHGVAIVKLMGRHSGFIAAGAAVVSQEVDFVLVPEAPFPLEGDHGLLGALERRVRERGHAVVVVAEGAGQHLFAETEQQRDASHNVLHQDIGGLLREKLTDYFVARSFPITLKYLDPSYYIRSVPASAYDRVLCDQMARHAVHAAMAGKTGMLIGYEHNRYINVPIPAVVGQTKCMEIPGDLWRAVLETTGQPRW